jgi:murein DD-endopeptidase MepM/ murein hydrolase activator NlpD
MKNRLNKCYLLILMMVCLAAMFGCKSGPFNLIKPASPHQQYERKITSAGLNQTTMGAAWIQNAQQSLQNALAIKLPFKETGYFAAEKVEAIAYRFKVTRGEKLTIELVKKPTSGFRIYADLWEPSERNDFKFIAAADTLNDIIQLDAEKTGDYILRLQPELLGGGQFTISLTIGPSLNYPLKAINKNQIQSLYGDGRDENTRKHEGIDIFAPFRTPVIAVSPGVVTGVNMNNLGGKVVWFRPEGKNYTLYYAHLDEQTVSEGQAVLFGDTLGRIGNTGNAINTPPHLHFGIYTNEGAVDPLPFINPKIIDPPRIKTLIARLNTTMRTNNNALLNGNKLKPSTIVRITGAAASEYRVELPNGGIGYLSDKILTSTATVLAKLKIKNIEPLYDKPDSSAAVKLNLKVGQTVDLLGSFGDYQLVIDQNQQTGWILIR